MEFITEAEIEEIGREVLELFIIPSYAAKGHNASGELQQSLRSRAEGNKAIFSGLEYAQYLIIGRRPNKDQSPEAINNWVKWFAPNVFNPWMQAKGLSGSAYPIAYKIAREGTKQFREPTEDFMAILGSQQVMDYVRDRIGQSMKVNIANTLRDQLRALRQ